MSQIYVLTCDKDAVYLSRDKPNHMYLIEFKAVNPKIHIDALLTFDIYRMMYELNKDLFESHHIVFPDPNDPSRAEILFIFKSIMGLGERYTHVYTHMPHLSNPEPLAQGQGQIIHISSANVPKGTDSLLKHLIPRRAEQIDSDNSNITIHVQSDRHAIQFYYEFKLQLSKPDGVISIPPFVDKAVSAMMKNIFVRMKQFIELIG
jgi:hypothetical protein